MTERANGAEPRVGGLLSLGVLAESGPIAPQVHRLLRQAVITNRLSPGQALSEQEIAAGLKVSRQPVREAFIKLAEAGLVQILPQRGTRVTRISAKQVMDARFVREAIEVAVVRRACARFDRDALRAAERAIAMQEEAAREDDDERFLRLDDEFHRALALGIDCERAWRVVEGVKVQMDRVRYLSFDDATPMERLIEQHRAILTAIRTRDAEAAEAAMRTHLSEILTSLPLLASRLPELFEGERTQDRARARRLR
jgi:GntR family transcriptional regulator, rspAB operon transcriptional repressor